MHVFVFYMYNYTRIKNAYAICLIGNMIIYLNTEYQEFFSKNNRVSKNLKIYSSDYLLMNFKLMLYHSKRSSYCKRDLRIMQYFKVAYYVISIL